VRGMVAGEGELVWLVSMMAPGQVAMTGPANAASPPGWTQRRRAEIQKSVTAAAVAVEPIAAARVFLRSIPTNNNRRPP
jgi:hypothetical protein